jgi:hypothetical protein
VHAILPGAGVVLVLVFFESTGAGVSLVLVLLNSSGVSRFRKKHRFGKNFEVLTVKFQIMKRFDKQKFLLTYITVIHLKQFETP